MLFQGVIVQLNYPLIWANLFFYAAATTYTTLNTIALAAA